MTDGIPALSAESLRKVLKRGKDLDTLGTKIDQALQLITTVLDDLGERQVAISFNGGKDCTVLLHLLAAVLYARHQSQSLPSNLVPSRTELPPIPRDEHDDQLHSSTSAVQLTEHIAPTDSASTSSLYPPIRSIYITAPNPFPSLDQFVLDTARDYNIDLHHFGGGMKAALKAYLGCEGGSEVTAMLMGTRRSDPNGDVPVIAPTDPSWPKLLRVHPLLDWTYAEIWAFLRELDVRYCHLYDEGYTSLGSTHNTIRNPVLQIPGQEKWNPAWKLTDEASERAGRLDTSS